MTEHILEAAGGSWSRPLCETCLSQLSRVQMRVPSTSAQVLGFITDFFFLICIYFGDHQTIFMDLVWFSQNIEKILSQFSQLRKQIRRLFVKKHSTNTSAKIKV